MPDLAAGEVVHVQGSAEKPYELKNTGGVYSCSCPAWRNQRNAIERRTCKHLKGYRGEDAELARVGAENLAGKPGTKAAGAAPAAAASGGGSKPAQKKETAPPVLLAHTWENDVDLTGWWLSEKLDGVRAYWDGGAFVSRLGNQFLAPDWFVAGLPAHPLDGELWIGRQRFQETISVVRRMDRSDAWKEVRYVLFDAPAVDGPFEARLEFLRAHFPPGKHAFAHYLEHVPCAGLDHLRQELARVEGLGGEGLMLRKPGSRYVAGRSSTLLKVKTFHDAEARVVAHLPGKGKHKGRLGALDVELPSGKRFSVGTGLSEKEREDPPPVGAIITFRYQELTDGGVPRFPSYVGLAIDKPWPPEGEAAPPTKVNAAAAGGAAKPAKLAASGTKTVTDAGTGSVTVTGSGVGSETVTAVAAPAPPGEAPGSEPEEEADDAPPAPAGPPRTTPEGIVAPAAHVVPPVRAARARLLRLGETSCELAVVGDTLVERDGPRTIARQLPGHGSAVANAEARLAARIAAGFTPAEDGPDRSPPPRYLVQKKAGAYCELVVVGDTLVERAGPAGSPGRTRTWQQATAAAALAAAEARVKERLKEGFVEA